MRWILALLCLLALSCATAKPCICPPAEVITVKVPVSVPCPPPADVAPANLLLPTLHWATATPDEIVLAFINDYLELQRVVEEQAKALLPYRSH